MEATIALRLPRDAASVPVIRQMLDGALSALGVEQTIREDIELMLSEACSNVIRHAAPSDDYTVSVSVDGHRCVIKVIDNGHGFDPSQVSNAGMGAEHGRGLQIMRALADDVRFTNRREHGTVVSLEKALRFVSDAPVTHLMTT